jgi:hypothetical protein
MFRLLIKPSSGVSNIEYQKVIVTDPLLKSIEYQKVVVTDPLLKSIELTIYITDGRYENQYTDIVYVKDKKIKVKIKYKSSSYKTVMCK